jgi:hypothetical protein
VIVLLIVAVAIGFGIFGFLWWRKKRALHKNQNNQTGMKFIYFFMYCLYIYLFILIIYYLFIYYLFYLCLFIYFFADLTTTGITSSTSTAPIENLPLPKQQSQTTLPTNPAEMNDAQLIQFLSTKLGEGKILTDVLKQEKLGSGNFGDVFLGNWSYQSVALKAVKERCVYVFVLFVGLFSCLFVCFIYLFSTFFFSLRANMDDFVKELQAALEMNAPSVVRFFGVTLIDDVVYAVLEYCSNGSLLNYLRQTGMRYFNLFVCCFVCLKKFYFLLSFFSSLKDLSGEKLLKVAIEATTSLSVLEQRKMIHRDIAARNFLGLFCLFVL